MLGDLTAVIFPGQGSQSVGMLHDIAHKFKIVRETFDEASATLGYDLWQLTQSDPADLLNQTAYTQPALLTASYALWRIIQAHQPLHPAVLAGHSLGEYTALLCAESLDFQHALKLVQLRGQYMQEAVPDGIGAMAALVGLDETAVNQLCHQAKGETNEVISPANFNSIGQIVIAGHRSAVDRAIQLAKLAGAKLAVRLPVSVPSHCALMLPAAERFALALADTAFSTPKIAILNNVDVLCYDSPQMIREGLTRQLSAPIRWVETMQKMAQGGILHLIECGPGQVLTGLQKRIDKRLITYPTGNLDHLTALLALNR